MRLDELEWNIDPLEYWDGARIPGTPHRVFRAGRRVVNTDRQLGEYIFSINNLYYPGGTKQSLKTADPITAQALLFYYLGGKSDAA